MSTTVTETAEYSNAALGSRPQDGDTIYMDAGAAPQWPLWARLYNRTAHHEGALSAHLSWSGDFDVEAGGSASSFTITLGAINAVNLYNASASVVKAYAGGTIGASKVQGGGATLGASAGWWYVYAFLNSGSLDFEISTTAPNANRAIKNGDATRVYLGCFRTLSTGAPIPVQASRGRYVYDLGDCAVADVRVLSAGAATTFTVVDCSTLVPPHGRIASLDVRAVLPLGGGAASSAVEVQKYGAAGAASHIVYCGAGGALDPTAATFDVRLDASKRAQYKVNGGANAPVVDILVAGFYE